MTALFAITTFFFIYVLVFTAISFVLSTAAWWMARPAVKAGEHERIQQIGRKIDTLKDKAFVISLVLTFFFVTPFAVIYIFLRV